MILKELLALRPLIVTEGKNYMGDKEYQSIAAWKRAVKAKHGDEVKYLAHEGTIDAMVGKKQVGHWDDTVGTLFEEASE